MSPSIPIFFSGAEDINCKKAFLQIAGRAHVPGQEFLCCCCRGSGGSAGGGAGCSVSLLCVTRDGQNRGAGAAARPSSGAGKHGRVSGAQSGSQSTAHRTETQDLVSMPLTV